MSLKSRFRLSVFLSVSSRVEFISILILVAKVISIGL